MRWDIRLCLLKVFLQEIGIISSATSQFERHPCLFMVIANNFQVNI